MTYGWIFVAGAGDEIEVTKVQVMLGEDVECSVRFTSSLAPGDTGVYVVNCSDPPLISSFYNTGDCFLATAHFSFTNTATGNSYISKGKISGSVEEGLVTTTTTTTSTSSTTTTTILLVDSSDYISRSVALTMGVMPAATLTLTASTQEYAMQTAMPCRARW